VPSMSETDGNRAARRPGKRLPMLRTSERRSYLRCRQAWWWEYVERLKPKDERKALAFGTLVHKALELYMPPGRKRGPHPAITFEALYAKHLADGGIGLGARGEALDDEDAKGDWTDGLALGQAMLNGYYDLYHEHDKRYEVLASEYSFKSPVLDEDGKVIAYYVGTFDGIWRDRGDKRKPLLLNDYKTAAQLDTSYLRLDEQANAYYTFGVDAMKRDGLLRDDASISTLLFNFLVKKMPDERPTDAEGRALNKDGSVSMRQPSVRYHREPVYRNDNCREQVMNRAIDQFIEMQLAREGEVPILKTPDRFSCGFCAYRDPCELHEIGEDYQEFIRLMYKTWSPYDAHVVYAEETQ
jgi:hypothetical protein